MRPYPQYGNITTSLYDGYNAYHGGVVMVDHRFGKGYQLMFTYIRSGGGFDADGKPVNGTVIDMAGFYPTGGSACNMLVGSAPRDSNQCYNDDLVDLSGYHVRTFPRNLGNLRNDGQNNWDINVVKKFQVTERITYQLKADFLNAFNHVWFNGIADDDPTKSNFGRITGQKNLPRNIQIGMKLQF